MKKTCVLLVLDGWGIARNSQSNPIYVAEKESMSEGMIKLASIKGDYYVHQASKYRVVGEKKGKVFRLGDEIKVKVKRADLEDRQIDFELIG